MLHVELENIFSEDDATSKARELIERVDTKKQVVVITRQNRPAVVMIDINQLEQLTGRTVTPVAPLAAPTFSSNQPTSEEATGIQDIPSPFSSPSPVPTPPPSNPLPLLPDLPELPDLSSESPLPPLPSTPPQTSSTSTAFPSMPSASPSMPAPAMPPSPAPAVETSVTSSLQPSPAPTSGMPEQQNTPTPVAVPQPPAGMDPRLTASPAEALPPEDLSSSSPLA